MTTASPWLLAPRTGADRARPETLNVGILSTYAPTPCGLATFSAALAVGLSGVGANVNVVRIADGFNSNTSLFKYARDLGNKRGDMYEIAVWEECIGPSGDDILFAINIPQEAVTIPETIDGIRAALCLQADRLEAVALTNQYLGMVAGR